MADNLNQGEEISSSVIQRYHDWAIEDFRKVTDLAALEEARVKYIGTNGSITALLKRLGELQKEERPAFGKLLNQAKSEVQAEFDQKLQELQIRATIPIIPTDFTLPGRRRALGKLHPLTQVTEDIVRSFRKIGFVVADGPEIEDEYHCFDALNTPADHPARDSQDTFYLATNAGGISPSPAGAGEGRGEGQTTSAAHPHLVRPNPRDEIAAAAGAHHRAGPRLSPRQRRRHT
jgi:phenylalanyl-tRNA synthetase alpha subunit